MKKLYEIISLMLVVVALPFIPVGFLICIVRFGIELGYSYAVRFERYGEKKGWESKEENDQFSKEHNLSL